MISGIIIVGVGLFIFGEWLWIENGLVFMEWIFFWCMVDL